MTPQPRPSRSFEDLSGLGQTLTWVSGLILAISAFTGWYVGSGPGPTTSVIGWHTGALGKLVFVIGLAVVALVILREAGIELPATVPESLVVIALGALSTIFVLIRLISIPDEFFGAGTRDRHLHQPDRFASRDRCRPLTSRRRAIATSTPSKRAADHVERIVHADVDA